MAPLQPEAHFIIIGAGSAGCVLANRLSSDPLNTVVLIEAGPDASPPSMRIPALYDRIAGDRRYGWNFASEPSDQTAFREIDLKRGRVVGGSSAINAMAFTRGHPADFNAWAEMGLKGWNYEDVLPYFRKLERSWRGASEAHGDSGPMPVSRYQRDEEIHELVKQAACKNGWPLNDDFDANGTDGYGCYDTTTALGRRASAARHYLDPARKRTNLTLISNSHVSRVIISDGRARGVAYIQNGESKQILASREVIVCGGSYGSPQILLLSGIGPADHLREHSIEVHAHLPGVGGNLHEQPASAIVFATNRQSDFDRRMRIDRLAWEFLRWSTTGQGILSGIPMAGVAFFRSSDSLPLPDLETTFITSGLEARPWFPGLRKPIDKTMLNVLWLLHPQSRGIVRLHSNCPPSAPMAQI